MNDSTANEINMGAGASAGQIASGPNITQTYIAQQIVNAPEPPREWKAPKQMLNVVPTFVGRHDALEKLATLGARGVTTPRLMLAGIGGFGKTSLAAQITNDLKHIFDGGILLAELPTMDVFLKLDEWAKLYAGDVTEIQDLNQRAERVREIIQQRVGRKRVLAVLDGIVDENDEPKLGPLVRALSDCAVLATTRDRYLPSLYHFREIPVENFGEQDAVALFQRVLPNDKRFDGNETQIHALGAAVDWLPFALDLLAKQLDKHREWTLANLQTKLAQSKLELLKWGSVNEKEKGIFASFLVSYDGLNAQEKTFFPTLGAFGGSDFDIQASAYVARGHPQRSTDKEDDRVRVGQVSAAQAEQMLEHLLELSMVQTGSAMGRYRLHALMREFARTLCDANSIRGNLYDADLRMATHYCEIAKYYGSWLENDDSVTPENILDALDKLSTDLTNIYIGQQWARQQRNEIGYKLTRNYIGKMINFFILRGLWKDAVEWLKNGIMACQQLNDEIGENALLGNLGITYFNLGDWNAALDYFQSSLSFCERSGNTRALGETYNNIGIVYRNRGQWDEAIRFFQKSLDQKEKLADLRNMGGTYNNLGLAYENKGELKLAVDFYSKAIDISQQFGDMHGLAVGHMNIGNMHFALGNWNEAIISLHNSLEIREHLEDAPGIAQVNSNLGMIYTAQGKSEIATQLFKQSMQTYEWLGDIYSHAKTSCNLALLYERERNWSEAIALYEKALRTFGQIGDVQSVAETYGNLGNAHFYGGNIEKSVECYKKLLELSLGLKDLKNVSRAYASFGNVLFALGNFDKAIEAYKSALSIMEDTKDLHGMSSPLWNLGLIYQVCNNLDEAHLWFDRCIELEENLGDWHVSIHRSYVETLMSHQNK